MLALIILSCLAVAAYLFVVCNRKFAAAGAVVIAVAIWSAFYLSSQAAPWAVWTVLFFVAVALIAYLAGPKVEPVLKAKGIERQ